MKNGFLRFLESIYSILIARPRVPASLENAELLKIILSRRSVRAFQRTDIPDDVMDAILEAGRLAPSTVNLQSWTFAVFTEQEWYSKFNTHIPFHALRAVLVMGDTHRARKVLDTFPDSPMIEYTIAVMNASLAAMNMNIAAEALGVSSVMLSETGRSGLLDAGFLKEKLDLPDGVFPLMTIVFGYARTSYPPMPPKLSLEDILMKDHYIETDRSTMERWRNRQEDGFKASHLNSSFEAQLRVYRSKIANAERDINDMVFFREKGNKA